MMTTDLVENYPGFPEGITGFELSDRMRQQAERFGLEIRSQEVLELKPGKPAHTVVLEKGPLTAGAIIIATGARYRRLGVPGEDKLAGRGVSFCATCDGAFFKDETIAMVGGGDNALTEILFLERFAKKIHLIHRRDQFRPANTCRNASLMNSGKVQVHLDTVVTEFKGQSALEALELRNVKTGEQLYPAGYRGLHRHRHGAQHRLARQPSAPGQMGLHRYRSGHGGRHPGHLCRRGCALQMGEADFHRRGGCGTVATIAVERYLETLKQRVNYETQNLCQNPSATGFPCLHLGLLHHQGLVRRKTKTRSAPGSFGRARHQEFKKEEI